MLTTDHPEPPEPEAGEVLLEVASAGVNPADVKIRLGLRELPEYPYVPGREASGTVLRVGSGVDRIRPRDRVMGYVQWAAHPGALAQRLTVPAELLAAPPSTISLLTSAVVPLSGSTALQAIRTLGLAPDDVVAILGASGGVGTFAVQLAHIAGATVIGVASSDSFALLAELGADVTLDYRDPSSLGALGFGELSSRPGRRTDRGGARHGRGSRRARRLDRRRMVILAAADALCPSAVQR